MPVFGTQMFGSGGVSGYEIEQSCRFNDDDSPKLVRTPSSASSATDRRKVTHSFWVKRGNLVDATLYSTEKTGVVDYYKLDFFNDKLRIIFDVDDSNFWYETSAVYRDPAAWYHICCIIDTTQGTDTNRVKLYVNGVLQTITTGGSGGHVSQNFETYVMDGTDDAVGQFSYNNFQYPTTFDGYMAEVILTIGQNNTIDEFGETDEDYGHWKPKEYAGSYGSNGFYFKFADSSALGTDSSGNGNTWTVSGLAATDQVIDTPTNNWNTLLPLASEAFTFSEGNLKGTGSSWLTAFSSIGVTSGKWYWEQRYTASAYGYAGVLIDQPNVPSSGSGLGQKAGGYSYYSTGQKQSTAGVVSYGTVWTTNDIIGIALDMDNGAVYFRHNGTWQASGDPTSGASKTGAAYSGTWGTGHASMSVYGSSANTMNFGQDGTFAGTVTAQGNSDANGKGDFYYTLPTDYLALCTANIPDPTVKPKEHFNTVLWSGDNADNRNITGYGFQPDIAWIKSRSHGGNGFSHNLWDSTRGVSSSINTGLIPDTDDPQGAGETVSTTAQLGGVSAFLSDGFTVKEGNTDDARYVNKSGSTYVGWGWKFNGGTTSTNNDGNASSTVQVNSDATMSIVQWEGTGSAQTVGHGLGVKPAFVLIKNFDTICEWNVWHKSFSVNEYMRFDESAGIYTASSGGDFWPNGITTSVIGLGAHSGNNQNGMTIIAYFFAEIDGWFATGRYGGNGNTNGPFIYTGFSPAWLVIKRTDSTSAGLHLDVVRSPQNVNNNGLETSNNNAESADETAFNVDILSNGFKIRASESTLNNGSGNYIYYAFSEYPFKVANAR